jgi:hypothetical protein
MRVLPILFVGVTVAVGAESRRFERVDQTDRFLFACSAFPASMTDVDLRKRFGPENVTTGSVADPFGSEGDETEGTLLFAKDENARLEIAWRDIDGARRLALIRRLADRGRWHTSSGIRSGTDLKTIEKLNRRPFRLVGLAFDLQGTVVWWSGGRLEADDSADCHIGMRLRVNSSRTGATAALERQVTGDKEFSSGHPAMQALNPTVYELVLWYGRRSAR